MRLLELFDNDTLNPALAWYEAPSNWRLADEQLLVYSDAKTDYWQRTHYGFQVDNGHFLYAEVQGDFTMETAVNCHFKHHYDQAGLMVRVSDQCWIKTAVEFEPSEPNKLGAVVTNHGYSDWSTQDVSHDFTNFKLKIMRQNSDYIIKYFSANADSWVQLRMCHLFDEALVMAGIYCCSPKASGFQVGFDYLKIE